MEVSFEGTVGNIVSRNKKNTIFFIDNGKSSIKCRLSNKLNLSGTQLDPGDNKKFKAFIQYRTKITLKGFEVGENIVTITDIA